MEEGCEEEEEGGGGEVEGLEVVDEMTWDCRSGPAGSAVTVLGMNGGEGGEGVGRRREQMRVERGG